ncbi:MAG: SUMF1/EgtB/PvdO family nonheme iron enzyme [Candidatus Eremiobacterota bacterium]
MNCSECHFENLSRARFCSACGHPLIDLSSDRIIDEGYILERRYEIIDIIKKGGMGYVYLARDIRLGRECAVKEMLQHSSAGDKYAIRRFEEEALLLSRLRHSGLAVVLDYFLEHGRYYLVMDYIKGKDGEAILKEYSGKPIEEDRVVDWSLQILDILDYLHNQNPPVVYRDLKPSNIMIRESDCRAILIDFGIARTVGTGSNTTKTTIGTMGYCALEQLKGKPEPRSDIYSLGITMHHMLTGVKPEGVNTEPVDKLNPSLSSNLVKVINKAIQLKLSSRFSSARDMADAIRSSEKFEKLIADDYPDMVFVPGGDSVIGSDKGEINEAPEHSIHMKAFLIDRYPVTNIQFDKFVRETGAAITHWRQHFRQGMENFPAVSVNWYEASMYAEWAGKRLPSEVEWEKAARGTDGRKYPWGDEWDNYSTGNLSTGNLSLSGVGAFPGRVSTYGVMDMVGTIYEWTSDWYYSYPYRGPYEKGKTKVYRGGKNQLATCSFRGFENPDYRSPLRGFRCAIDC